MDCKNNEDKIISYLENDLSDSEKLEFEKELSSDSLLNSEFNEIKQMLNSLDRLPKVRAKDNFIVSLNEKIDIYEEKRNKSWSLILNGLFTSNNISTNGTISSGISILAISAVCIICVTFYLGQNNTDSGISLSKSRISDIETDNQVANVDTLDSIDR